MTALCADGAGNMPEYSKSDPETVSVGDLPLVVEIGDLVATNWHDEYRLACLRAAPLTSLLPFRSHREAALRDARTDVLREAAHWPMNMSAVDELASVARSGRKVVLVTSAPEWIAVAIASRVPFLSDAIADAPAEGHARRAFLAERFPEGSSAFVSRSGPNWLPVARGEREERSFASSLIGTFTLWRKFLRLHQWAKNLLIVVPLVLGGKMGDAGAWFSVAFGFLALGLVASATYIINDLVDLPSDRKHWSKRHRPLASGRVSIRFGALTALALLAGGFGLILSQTFAALVMLLVYCGTTLLYSAYFKRVPMLDVLVLACLFTIRLGMGIALTDVQLSPWLLVFSMFIFLSLSVAKRHTEILRTIELQLVSTPGRGYRSEDAPLTLGLGLASGIAAVLIMVVYLIEDAVPRQIYKEPLFLWAIPPILFLFLGRIWLLSQRGELNDDPVAFALKDAVSVGYGAAIVAALTLALTGLGLS